MFLSGIIAACCFREQRPLVHGMDVERIVLKDEYGKVLVAISGLEAFLVEGVAQSFNNEK